jgi:hypothetical protein
MSLHETKKQRASPAATSLAVDRGILAITCDVAGFKSSMYKPERQSDYSQTTEASTFRNQSNSTTKARAEGNSNLTREAQIRH